ncbi:hypothetical protein LTR99_006147 [Exophiala xenobiotica]|uniref:Phytanoyl-CoA dioxygenase n=1 Tax=Vermiconidia calcicola TaxID=1690605 RepID=A0AAV9Q837_9PEZI|nr:hypothetical protein LTR92_010315 [Exophiala xenobiotica]KAK5533096.1 hypothetical protein LTR23_009393 [Chaetothyriales sp. CCFEE 6169]KAK5537319.1 hypothetical protein LTR25_004570 [Vermiconidia calcicola]KAK5217145.1 hypothetical protein LTR72_009711 [Exophiala xenobiotica]KAK5244577.1 hypothetical protein LTS06_009875 [Exophiala xenobiotica]
MPSAKTPFQHQNVVVVHLSDEERTSGNLEPSNIGKAVAAMHRDGIVVLENAVDVEHVDTLNNILSEEAKIMATLPTTHFNDFSTDGNPIGNMSQGPPLSTDLMYEDIWANSPADQVLSYILGPRPCVNYVNGNTALGGFNARQRVHADLTFNHGTFPFAIVTNFYLSDVSPANGSTELWIATHRDTTFADHRNCGAAEHPPATGADKMEFGIRDELLEERKQTAPPIQPVVKKGSVVLRDLRLWHAGLSNPAVHPRIMLAFVHTPAWYECPAKVVLPEAARGNIEAWATREHNPVEYKAHFVPAELDHTKVKFNPNFSSNNKGYISMLPDLPEGLVLSDDSIGATKMA